MKCRHATYLIIVAITVVGAHAANPFLRFVGATGEYETHTRCIPAQQCPEPEFRYCEATGSCEGFQQNDVCTDYFVQFFPLRCRLVQGTSIDGCVTSTAQVNVVCGRWYECRCFLVGGELQCGPTNILDSEECVTVDHSGCDFQLPINPLVC